MNNEQHFVKDFKNFNQDSLDLSYVILDLKPSSLWHNAWEYLKKRPIFWFAIIFILIILLLTFFPSLFTSEDPNYCVLSRNLSGPIYNHWFGFDKQGCDIFARIVYGARSSVFVGILTTILVILIGGTLGALAGFYGGLLDAIISRIIDIFFAIPLVLAAIVIMQLFKENRSIFMVILVLAFFGWTSIARIMRSSVMVIKNYEFVMVAKSLGRSNLSILLVHILPNAIAPVIVYATVALGTFIIMEATLSFLGIGLPSSIISWGADIAKAQSSLRINPMVLFYPSIALALTVLSFIMLSDVIKDALNPKSKK